jgi:hypothetical protein
MWFIDLIPPNRLMQFNFTNFQNKISGFVLKKDNAALSVIFISPDARTVLACRSFDAEFESLGLLQHFWDFKSNVRLLMNDT